MTLVERLRKLERTLDLAGIRKDATTVRAAIARIEAADRLLASMLGPVDMNNLHCDAIADLRALVREQDKEAPHA